MEKNQRNPRRRLNSLILLVAFTAVMLIVSTYAWFSAQKNVTVSNLEGKVNVAEGLEISLDAEHWSQEIDFADYDSSAGTTAVDIYEGTDDNGKSLSTMYGSTPHNILPSELLPVSSTGYGTFSTGVGDGIGKTEMVFYNATNKNEIELSEITEVDDLDGTASADDSSDDPYYFAIDLFLRNSSRLASGEEQGVAKETLQLNTNSLLSLVSAGSTSTGLQNTVRVALALYEPYLKDGSGNAITGADVGIGGTQNQSTYLTALTGENAKISDIAIWEPNADKHVDYIVTNNNKLTWWYDESTTDLKTASLAHKALYLTTDIGVSGEDGYIAKAERTKFLGTEKLPTYALTATSVGKTFTDIYNWNIAPNTTDTTTGLRKQIALQTSQHANDDDDNEVFTIAGGVKNLVSVTSTGEDIYENYGVMEDSATTTDTTKVETGAVEFQIYKNQVSRIRMYVWLEGQDVDCVNYASHGSGIHLDLGLVKGVEPGETESGPLAE